MGIISTGEMAQTRMYRQRWWMLLVLSISLMIVVIDTTILNVAIPTLQRELGASASTLQWIVDSFVLSVADLLLTMGALGDKFGLKRALLGALVVLRFMPARGPVASIEDWRQIDQPEPMRRVGEANRVPNSAHGDG